jgi:hypothetical protein
MIYLISDGDRLKIGKSKHPQKRLAQLQTACGLKLRLIAVFNVPDYYEKRLHNMLRFNRAKNEWFKLDNETFTWVQEYLREAEINLMVSY